MVVVNRFEDLDVYIKTLKEIGDIDIEIFVSNLISNLDYGFFQLETDKLEELDDFELYSILEKIADIIICIKHYDGNFNDNLEFRVRKYLDASEGWIKDFLTKFEDVIEQEYCFIMDIAMFEVKKKIWKLNHKKVWDD